MKVAKFGGTSLANAKQIIKVAKIITSDADRKVVIVSAPGKRHDGDIKVTDMLIELGEKRIKNEEVSDVLRAIVERYRDIAIELGLDESIVKTIESDLQKRAEHDPSNEGEFMDQMKAAGEDNNAKLIARYLEHLGYTAQYVSPKDARLYVTDTPGNAQVLPETYDNLFEMRERDGILILPGFFGYSKNNRIVTFPRGGSDITGSIIAAGVKADLYENFTDVDSVFSANPKVVEDPTPIKRVTFREMRELSYAGFGVFHDEALIPAFRSNIPVCVKNTNNPDGSGTMIESEREYSENPVIGIAAQKGFATIYVRKYLMNREVGFGRRLLEIIEDECISYEHIPSGIDDTSVILEEEQLTPEKEEIIIHRIKEELDADDAYIEKGFAMIMLVGEGMHETIGIASRATKALAEENVNIDMINQGSSEVSLSFGINEEDADKAIRGLYKEFFAAKDVLQ